MAKGAQRYENMIRIESMQICGCEWVRVSVCVCVCACGRGHAVECVSVVECIGVCVFLA